MILKTFITIFTLILMQIASFAQFKTISYKDDNQQLNGLYLAAKNSKKAILILPAWKGIDQEAKDAALALQKEGYHVFIADIYGAGNIPQSNEEAKIISAKYKKDYTAYQLRIKLALAALKTQSKVNDQVAIIGYCFGGTGSLEAARGNITIKGVVSIHGGLGKGDRPNLPIQTKVLILNGAADASVTKEDIQNVENEMNSNQVDWQFINYAQCKHTWTNPESADFDPLNAKRAWDHLLLFLKEIL